MNERSSQSKFQVSNPFVFTFGPASTYIFLEVLSFTERQRLLWADQLPSNEDGGSTGSHFGEEAESDWEDEELAGLMTFPPGEEGFLQSHAGGEAVLQDVMDGITMSVVLFLIAAIN